MPQRYFVFASSCITLLSSCVMPYSQQTGYPQGGGASGQYQGQGYQQGQTGAYVPPGYQQPQQQGQYPYPPQQQGQYAPPQQQQPQQPPAQSDYLPHLAQEYRSGYDIGAKDRQMGYPRDYRRAYERFGRGYESYFQEGYADGYDGNRIRH